MKNPMEDVIRLCQGNEVIAVATLKGTIVECSSSGVERAFGLKSVAVLSKNILTLVDSSLDQMEFQNLIYRDRGDNASAGKMCLLRAKGTKTFIWVDRRPPGPPLKAVFGLLPRPGSDSPMLTEVPTSSRKVMNCDKMYQALDTADMSFNDVFEDTYSPYQGSRSRATSIVAVTPSASEQSLFSDDGKINALSPRDSENSEDESNWGWFKTVSPSSSVYYKSSQIPVMG
jgi:hypothetical protein